MKYLFVATDTPQPTVLVETGLHVKNDIGQVYVIASNFSRDPTTHRLVNVDTGNHWGRDVGTLAEIAGILNRGQFEPSPWKEVGR